MATTTTTTENQLHVLFFPYMSHGHTIPMLDIAKLFSSKNLKTTIATTPLNAPLISRQINSSEYRIDVQLLQFPASADTGLPEGCEHFDFILSRNLAWEVFDRFSFATTLLQQPLEKLLEELRPDLIIADQFFPWATDSASKFGIPRVVFHGTGFFAMCAAISVEMNIIYGNLKNPNVTSDPTPFIIPDLPDEITITGRQIPAYPSPSETVKLFWQGREAELTSFGVIINSFYELEPAYAHHFRYFLGRRAWSIGPVSLCNRDNSSKSRRGIEASIDQHECLKWLDSKKADSVVYLSFGSMSEFSAAQLKEIAIGLELSGKDFIWPVIRRTGDDEDWLPEGFEERMEGKGLIIRGWAPQVVILEHNAVGGFVSHCGWNSTLEAIVAGLPMVTWPIGAEQFYNEKLLTDVLKIGVSVGVEEWTCIGGASIKSETVKMAVNRIMEGEEAEEMRNKVKELGDLAKKAVEEGGSSYCDLDGLIDELKIKIKNKN